MATHLSLLLKPGVSPAKGRPQTLLLAQGSPHQDVSKWRIGEHAHQSSPQDASLVPSVSMRRLAVQPQYPQGTRGRKQVLCSNAGMETAFEDIAPKINRAPLSELGSRLARFTSAFYKFTRPHTMAGTFISILSISVLALQGQTITRPWINGLGLALASALLMNIFIVGLNQVYDIDIDKINKPNLPLASGEYSVNTAVMIIAVSGFLSLVIGTMAGSPALLITLVVSMVLGIAYSSDVKFLRWKKNAFGAACCVLIIRAVAVQLGFYFHMQHSIGVAHIVVTKPLLSTICLMLFFSVVIALFKDIPDVKGDEQKGVRTFSVQLGQEKVFWLCLWLLTLMYGAAFGVGLASEVLWSKALFPASQALLTCVMWKKATSMDMSKKSCFVEFYMFVWKLFYAQYLFIPFLR